MPQSTGFTVWLTGMHGSGKSTLAHYLAQRLRAGGRNVEVIDHNELEPVLLNGLTLSKEDRMMATRRLGLLSKLLTRNDCIAVVASVSPYREARDTCRREINRFVEVFVDCPTEVLIQRDSTGQYKKALAGELPNFTGVTDPYETPQHAEATVRTDLGTVEQCAAQLLQSLVDIGYVTPGDATVMLGKRIRPTPLHARRPAKAKAAKAKPKAAVRAKAKVVSMARPGKRVAPRKSAAKRLSSKR